jgi:hypothetical protein
LVSVARGLLRVKAERWPKVSIASGSALSTKGRVLPVWLTARRREPSDPEAGWPVVHVNLDGLKGRLMSKRIDKSWLVFSSVENLEHNRCVDLFSRPDGTFGFDEFRRDPEDGGEWTPLQFYSGVSYRSPDEALNEAKTFVPWLTERLNAKPR